MENRAWTYYFYATTDYETASVTTLQLPSSEGATALFAREGLIPTLEEYDLLDSSPGAFHTINFPV